MRRARTESPCAGRESVGRRSRRSGRSGSCLQDGSGGSVLGKRRASVATTGFLTSDAGPASGGADWRLGYRMAFLRRTDCLSGGIAAAVSGAGSQLRRRTGAAVHAGGSSCLMHRLRCCSGRWREVRRLATRRASRPKDAREGERERSRCSLPPAPLDAGSTSRPPTHAARSVSCGKANHATTAHR